MRVLVFLACLALAVAVRDQRFWQRLMYSLAPRANTKVVTNIASRFNSFIQEFRLTNDRRISHFLGQCALESGMFSTTTEYANGEDYDDRYDLGNTQPGDGPRFKGRGLIQLTGRANYATMAELVGQDLLANPESVAEFPLALTVSGIYWVSRPLDGKAGTNLNDAADANDYEGVTRNINGARMLALTERTRLTRRAFTLLKADVKPGPITGVIPHITADLSSVVWGVTEKKITYRPPLVGGRFIGYFYEGIAHYTDGTVDTESVPSRMMQPDPARGPVAYYLNGKVVYQADVAPAPRLAAASSN